MCEVNCVYVSDNTSVSSVYTDFCYFPFNDTCTVKTYTK